MPAFFFWSGLLLESRNRSVLILLAAFALTLAAGSAWWFSRDTTDPNYTLYPIQGQSGPRAGTGPDVLPMPVPRIDGTGTHPKATNPKYASKSADPTAVEPTPVEPTPVERFATLDAPDVVKPGQKFAVEFALTSEQETPSARVTSGEVNAQGQLELTLPPPLDGKAWQIDVALRAPGFRVVDGNNLGQLRLPIHGDSSPVMFQLVANEITLAHKPRKLRVSLWHRGVFLARVARAIIVAKEGSDTGSVPASFSEPQTARSNTRPSVSLNRPARQADLTLYVLHDAESERAEVLLTSRLALSLHRSTWNTKGLRSWLDSRVTTLAGKLARGRSVGTTTKKQSAVLAARGFGRELYQRFAPDAFRQQFFQLADKLGEEFQSIEIHSDDPSVPWELMRPIRADGSGERDFLGVELSVGRWHISPQAAVRQRPPELVAIDELVVIAPKYDGSDKLPATTTEVTALQTFPGFRKVAGREADLTELMQRPPRGIIHFCGHGFAPSTEDRNRFAILLEDGELDLMTWQGMAGTQLAAHPFFFFNACDIGRTQRVADFVDGWAPAALELGASGYVGALWPINDMGAAAFAEAFYTELAKQMTPDASIATVLRNTRAARLAEGDATGLAYAFYGDPHLRVRKSR